jgi:hypothetical protein
MAVNESTRNVPVSVDQAHIEHGGPSPTGARQRHRDPRHLRPSMAPLRGPDLRSRRLDARSRGLAAVWGGIARIKSLVRGLATVSRPVGGVLFALPGEVAIHLSGLPGDCPRGAGGPPMSHVRPCSGWGLPSRPGHPGRWCALAAPFHPCLCGLTPAIGGLLSVSLSFGSPRLAVSQHPALWSPDLPRHGPRPRTDPWRGHPADSPSRSVCQVGRP